MSQLIEEIDFMSIEEVNPKLKSILLEPAIKTFPPEKIVNYVKQSTSPCIFAYENHYWETRKAYYKARHEYNLRMR